MFERKGYKLGSIRREEDTPVPDGPAEAEATKKATAKKAASEPKKPTTQADTKDGEG